MKNIIKKGINVIFKILVNQAPTFSHKIIDSDSVLMFRHSVIQKKGGEGETTCKVNVPFKFEKWHSLLKKNPRVGTSFEEKVF